MDLTPGLKITCPACQQVATSTRYGPGRPVESGPIQPPSITFEPCGHGMTGWAAARQHYRISDLVAAYRAGREDAAKEVISAADDDEHADLYWEYMAMYGRAKEIVTERGSE